MVYQEAEQLGLRRRLTKQAIALAMEGRWREAIAVNKEIIESIPNDVDAYNRLGKAYMELGEYSESRDAYQQAIGLDPCNVVAIKNLRRLSHLEETGASATLDSDKVGPEQFIEETGKAGVVDLYYLGPSQAVARLATGDKVYLKVEGANLVVEDGHGEYLGQVDPKHGQRLVKLIEGGNRYTAAVVSSAEDKVSVIIREVYQEPGQAGKLSFPARGAEGILPPISDKLLRRGFEEEETSVADSGFTIIGGEEREVFTEESTDEEKAEEEE